MKNIVIIPARYASTRFPGKPLINIGGKTMIQRVYEQANKVQGIHAVVVATDDKRIAVEVKRFGGACVITSKKHKTGTDRCNEAAKLLGLKANDNVINVQGDEPFITPAQIDQLVQLMQQKNIQIGSLCRKIKNAADVTDPSKVKVVFDSKSRALYFSRSAVPFVRSVQEKDWLKATSFYVHVGIYAYKCGVLSQLAQLKPSVLEKAESLEQLRWLQAGYNIHLAVTKAESVGIDTPEDLKRIKHLITK